MALLYVLNYILLTTSVWVFPTKLKVFWGLALYLINLQIISQKQVYIMGSLSVYLMTEWNEWIELFSLTYKTKL